MIKIKNWSVLGEVLELVLGPCSFGEMGHRELSGCNLDSPTSRSICMWVSSTSVRRAGDPLGALGFTKSSWSQHWQSNPRRLVPHSNRFSGSRGRPVDWPVDKTADDRDFWWHLAGSSFEDFAIMIVINSDRAFRALYFLVYSLTFKNHQTSSPAGRWKKVEKTKRSTSRRNSRLNPA